MTTPTAKYMVLKIGDWLDAREKLNAITNTANSPATVIDEILHDLDGARVDDAMVIRQQDVFAPGVLHTYASAVQSAIEVLGQSADASAPGIADLADLRDRFFEAAEASVAMQRKIPD